MWKEKQLELCAFTLKGEHHVYSLIPNIAVCMYIYIYWPKVNLYQVVVGQQSVRTLFNSCNFFCKCVLKNGRRYPFWMSKNHFVSHFLPFQINTTIFIFVKFFYKMAASGHFGCPKITFGRISGHFRSIRNFLAPPAERQRSFSNADSSVRLSVRPSSTFQLKAWFLKNCLITFFLFWHVASLGWYQCIVKIWIWLNHPKGHFERSNLAPFILGGNFLKNCLITFALFM